jgi:hypothetical protein
LFVLFAEGNEVENVDCGITVYVSKEELCACYKANAESLCFGILFKFTVTADVADARHGEWIMHTNSDGNLNHYECSVCHIQQGYLSNYCEDCGTKMDGDK